MTAALAKLEGAVMMLAEAKSLEEVKHVHDIAQAAGEYARAARLGLEAQNHAAEVKLRAERKAGELLAGLERTAPQDARIMSSVGHDSEYREVLEETGTTRQAANRWQQIATLPEEEFEQYIAETVAEKAELTTAGVLRVAQRREKDVERAERTAANYELIEQAPDPGELSGCFTTIVIDPPWDWDDEGDASQFGRGRPTYATMPMDDLLDLPVGSLADDNAHLYLWITNRSLPKGFALMEAWGFRYVTCLTWVKPDFGMGNYFRGQTEHILFGVRGSLPLLRHDVGTVFHAGRGPDGHSSKPEEAYELIESCSPGPYLDMFGRRDRTGWKVWGENGITTG